MPMTGKLITLPYVKGVPEYAMGFLDKISQLEGEKFVVAVDLPDGLEKKIRKAVRKLPRISLIVDDMGRAIPIIPTDAAIEAVRTSMEYGYQIHFLDAGMPVPKKKFIGIEKFYHLVDRMGVEEYSQLLQPYKVEYQDVRDNYMAFGLKELLEKDQNVVFLCDIRHYQNVLKLLENPTDYGCGYLGSTITCKVTEKDVWKISQEIPFIMSIYENNRKGFNRQNAILKLYRDGNINLELIEVYRYVRNLALTDGQLYPDLYNLIAAAKYVKDDEYAYKILKRSEKYPFSYLESNCKISRGYLSYDLDPLPGQRVLKIKKKLKLGSEFVNKKKIESSGFFIRRFKRTSEYLKTEREFARYLRNNFFYLVPTEEYHIEEFQSGLGDGIAIRESVRYNYMDKIYIKEDLMINNTAYVVEFDTECNSSIFFDTQNYCVGTATSQLDEYNWSCFTILPDSLDEKIEQILFEVSTLDPLGSCIKVAQKYSDFTYVFTDHPEQLENKKLDKKNIKILPLNRIPPKLRDDMQTFSVKYKDQEAIKHV